MDVTKDIIRKNHNKMARDKRFKKGIRKHPAWKYLQGARPVDQPAATGLGDDALELKASDIGLHREDIETEIAFTKAKLEDTQTNLHEREASLKSAALKKPLYDKFTLAPYWGRPGEEDFEAYAAANADFADGGNVEDAWDTDESTEFRARLDSLQKAADQKAQVDIQNKAFELVKAGTWTADIANADVKLFIEQERDAYLKTAFSFLTDAQILELKTDDEAAKATVGEDPVSAYRKTITDLDAQAADAGAGGGLTTDVKDWNKTKADVESAGDWVDLQEKKTEQLEKVTTEVTAATAAYATVVSGTQFLPAPIEETIAILKTNITLFEADNEELKFLKEDIEEHRDFHTKRIDDLPDSKLKRYKSDLLDLPSAKQAYAATLNASLANIKDLMFDAIKKGETFIELYHLEDFLYPILLDRGYYIEVYADGSTSEKADAQYESGKDLAKTQNFRIHWSLIDLHNEAGTSNPEQTWFTTINQRAELGEGPIESPKAS